MHPSGPALKRAYADAPTGQVHYYDSGGPGVPLLLLHQSPTSAIDFELVFPLFAKAGIRVIAPDTPGLGMSDAPKHEPVIADYADAVIAVLDHAGVDRVDAFGHHTGAQVAVEAAARHPERFRKLALYGVPVMSPAEQRAFWDAVVPEEREKGLFSPEPGGRHLLTLFERLESHYGTRMVHRMTISRLLAGPTLWYAHNAALTHDMTPSLKAVGHPLLLITHPGEMLHANTTVAHAVKPEAELVVLDTNCPVAMDGAPEALAEAVVRFLKA